MVVVKPVYLNFLQSSTLGPRFDGCLSSDVPQATSLTGNCLHLSVALLQGYGPTQSPAHSPPHSPGYRDVMGHADWQNGPEHEPANRWGDEPEGPVHTPENRWDAENEAYPDHSPDNRWDVAYPEHAENSSDKRSDIVSSFGANLRF